MLSCDRYTFAMGKKKRRTKKTPAKAASGAMVFVTIFALFWTAFTGLFDAKTYSDISNQQRAVLFPTTAGQVLQSQVEREHDADGTTYSADIRFAFEVEGEQFESDSYRFGVTGHSDQSEANRAVSKYPVGADVTVYYDPQNPELAILEPGVGGTDFFMLLFLTPFNLVMLGSWWLLLQMIAVRVKKPIAGGFKIQRLSNDIVRVRIPAITPLAAAFIAACVATALSILIASFLMGMSPSLEFVYGAWAVSGLVAAGVCLWCMKLIKSGKRDLVIDHSNKTLALPQTCGRSELISLPIAAIRDVKLKREVKYSSEGSSETWIPTLVLKPGFDLGDNVRAKDCKRIVEIVFAYRADGFTDWLRDELGIARS